MHPGWSESKVEDPEFEEPVGWVLDLANVNSILDRLGDNGRVHRKSVDVERGERSYCCAP